VDTHTDRQTDRNTETHTQSFYGSMDFVCDKFNLGEPVPEETFTHSHIL